MVSVTTGPKTGFHVGQSFKGLVRHKGVPVKGQLHELVSNSTGVVGSSLFIMLERFVPVSPSSAPECPGLPRMSMVALWFYPGPTRSVHPG